MVENLAKWKWALICQNNLASPKEYSKEMSFLKVKCFKIKISSDTKTTLFRNLELEIPIVTQLAKKPDPKNQQVKGKDTNKCQYEYKQHYMRKGWVFYLFLHKIVIQHHFTHINSLLDKKFVQKRI